MRYAILEDNERTGTAHDEDGFQHDYDGDNDAVGRALEDADQHQTVDTAIGRAGEIEEVYEDADPGEKLRRFLTNIGTVGGVHAVPEEQVVEDPATLEEKADADGRVYVRNMMEVPDGAVARHDGERGLYYEDSGVEDGGGGPAEEAVGLLEKLRRMAGR